MNRTRSSGTGRHGLASPGVSVASSSDSRFGVSPKIRRVRILGLMVAILLLASWSASCSGPGGDEGDPLAVPTGEAAADARAVALSAICATRCTAGDAGSVLVELRPYDASAGDRVFARFPMVEVLGSDASLSSALEVAVGTDAAYSVRQPRVQGRFVIVQIESTIRVDGRFSFRSDDVVLESAGSTWLVVTDPSSVGVTVTSAVE